MSGPLARGCPVVWTVVALADRVFGVGEGTLLRSPVVTGWG